MDDTPASRENAGINRNFYIIRDFHRSFDFYFPLKYFAANATGFDAADSETKFQYAQGFCYLR